MQRCHWTDCLERQKTTHKAGNRHHVGRFGGGSGDSLVSTLPLRCRRAAAQEYLASGTCLSGATRQDRHERCFTTSRSSIHLRFSCREQAQHAAAFASEAIFKHSSKGSATANWVRRLFLASTHAGTILGMPSCSNFQGSIVYWNSSDVRSRDLLAICKGMPTLGQDNAKRAPRDPIADCRILDRAP